MPQKKGLLDKEKQLYDQAKKSEADSKAKKAERAADTRHRLGVINPFSRNWKPTEKVYTGKSHPALQKV